MRKGHGLIVDVTGSAQPTFDQVVLLRCRVNTHPPRAQGKLSLVVSPATNIVVALVRLRLALGLLGLLRRGWGGLVLRALLHLLGALVDVRRYAVRYDLPQRAC